MAPGSSLSVKVKARGDCHPGNPGGTQVSKEHAGVRLRAVRQWRAAGDRLQHMVLRVLQPKSIFMVISRALSTFEKILLNFNLTFPKLFIMSLFLPCTIY